MKKEILDNANVTSSSEQITVLKRHFPACFDKDGNFMPEKLTEIVKAEGADISREGYSLNWLGKSYARLMANLRTETLLAANVEHNAKDENKNSENILIQGDNLDVLKHLKNAYAEQIKMIYIDPPYNTGSDGFVYQDDRKFTVEELAELAGIDENESKRILDFTNSSSSSHSAWLTFIYPRLYIARELLSQEGIVFISIDDNEQAQLRMLCDEIFGPQNYIGLVSRATGTRMGSGSKGIARELDYLLCYSSNGRAVNRLDMTTKELSLYSLEDDIGKYLLRTLRRTGGENRREDRPSMFFPVLSPDGTEVFPIAPEGWESRWSCGEDTYHALVEGDEIVWKEVDGEWKVYQKFYAGDSKKEVSDLWTDVEGNKKATRETTALFDGTKIFTNPKSVGLLKRVVELGTSENDLILDFFAGSGTTAHAVMALNSENNGRRRHITVQLDEPTDPKSEANKVGYETIFEITRERILRAAKKIQADNPDAECDFGFKEFRTVTVFDGYLGEADTPDQYNIFDGDKLTAEQRSQLLLTWQVYDCLPLTLDLTEVDLKGYTAHQGQHILYCMNSGLSLDHILAMLSRIDTDDGFGPTKIVIFESVLSSKAKREITEAIKGYNNRKGLPLELEIRL